MKKKYQTSTFLCGIVLLFTWCGYADEPATVVANDQVAELKAMILEMQEQMADMQHSHQQELDALKNELEVLRQQGATGAAAPAEDEAASLRSLAEGMVSTPDTPEKAPEETVFKARGLSLSQMNPEISASGDFLGYLRDQRHSRNHAGMDMRGLELNFQSYLDPFSRMKATLHVTEEEVHLEEAYFTRFSVFNNVNMDMGKFRQQFGIVNRWHEDALDQVFYPLALQYIFGEEGLAQTGISLDWTLPQRGKVCHGLTLQITGSDNEELFTGDTWGRPAVLAHYKNYRDLSTNTYMEFGLSGLLGWNDEWDTFLWRDDGFQLFKDHDALATAVYGADFSLVWEPVDRALYRNLEWRSEVFFLDRDILAPDWSGKDNIQAWGAYSYLQSKLAKRLDAGIRVDYFQPDSKRYANMPGASLAPLAYTSGSPQRWQVAPYVTWWQSEFVKFRVEYDYAWGHGMEEPEHALWLQANFAVGPHKHERY